ncbi:MAG: thioether cross-link-forming SCIFF peptide maturase [Eubacteriaceae bacterium]|nr:thioether cross-link-forming SCIFF peptide maturase [Eubacteriaceae bacterium]
MLHKFYKNGLYIIYDNVSGVLFESDALAYDVLEYINSENDEKIIEIFNGKYNITDLKETISELRNLIDENLIFEKEKNYKPGENFGIIKALCLNIAHDCDLRCKYCFASQGSYNSKRALMRIDVAKASIDFLINNSGKRHNLEIDFFGGEPLLNFDVVKQTVLYAKQREKECGKKFKFTLTTNALKLDDEISDFLNEHMDNVVLSLDGRAEIHDAMRPQKNGQASYDIIIKNILDFIKKRKDKEYYVRGTYTALNKDFSQDVIDMSNLGIKNISVEPVSSDERFKYSLSEKDLDILDREYDKIAQEYISRKGTDREFLFFHFNIDINSSPCVYKKISGCGAGTDYMAVSPDGKLYPCHQFDSIEEFYLGNVFDGIINKEIGQDFFQTSILTKEECKNCWAKYHCGGGCYASGYKANNDIHKSDNLACEMLKKRLEYALMIKVIQSKS